MISANQTLRDRLRFGTRAAQDALDRAQRRFDLSSRDGRGRFLRAQADTIATLRRADDGTLDAALVHALDLLAADLAVLGDDAPPVPRTPPATDDALARGYVWHGQRLALRMLARSLPDGADGTAYLLAPRDADAWRSLCADLETTSGYGALPDRVLTAANDWLALLETLCHDHARR
ncbi:hypothetical protein [Jannaschia rubra]|uniref:Heme oxygenase n=1 Tax=Jannaschia rubra TaxID=282197 RepID=A0A0M6XSG1_9RHOB|nr:hypothetical protein [Jannaschia rubra]CTQ33728.1 hypothetical protein JAN5088_02513 [Jannaschia rubra]SFG07556.1 hypothetical protein SAMN04488517_102562 [Jannaschia rubra]